MKIRQFSILTGLSVDTLRYYEKEGLLKPNRDINGYRQYTEHDIEWVQAFLRLKRTNMPLTQIKEYSRLRHLGDETVAQRYKMLLTHAQYLQDLQAELAEHQTYLRDKLAIYGQMLTKK
ncbi:MAG TPA: MerR family transcriptional regulator [Pasteurellaceae bacterium]|nr:MerR family transcriptional regulator [Pasteurellaceae bacterium]